MGRAQRVFPTRSENGTQKFTRNRTNYEEEKEEEGKKTRGTFLYVLYTPGEFYIRVISNGGSGIMSWGSAACMSYISTRGVLPLIFFYFVKVGKMLFYVVFVNWFLVRR